MPDKIYPLTMEPGIDRDGTEFSTRSYSDGQWCRFYRGMPKKINGYKQLVGELPNIVYGVFIVSNSAIFDVYFCDQASIKYISVKQNGNRSGAPHDRTPAGFLNNANNNYIFDIMYSDTSNSTKLFVHVAPNLLDINSRTAGTVYYGDINSSSNLEPTGISGVSGGIVVLHPYLFVFGNDGYVSWSVASKPTDFSGKGSGTARISGTKVIAGFPTRGGNSSPAGLLWTLDSLIRVTFVGGDTVFRFDTVSSDSSILSSAGIVEYNGFFYWAGVDRFYFYNGVVQELPNSMSLRFFFDNLNYTQRQKVWATKITEWGEIWWHFPRAITDPLSPYYSGGAYLDPLECNWAIIYNVRENTWYDTFVERSAGHFAQNFQHPIWADNKKPTSSLWIQEIGHDKVFFNGNHSSIESHFETGDIAWCAYNPNQQRQDIDRWVSLSRVEPDLIQSGEMLLTVRGKEYARSPRESVNTSNTLLKNSYTFDPSTTKIDMRQQRREMTLRFHSDVIGGNYQLGQTLIVAKIGDERT